MLSYAALALLGNQLRCTVIVYTYGASSRLRQPMGRSESADVLLVWKPPAASKQVVRVDSWVS